MIRIDTSTVAVFFLAVICTACVSSRLNRIELKLDGWQPVMQAQKAQEEELFKQERNCK